MTTHSISVSIEIKAPQSKVWAALTEPEQIKKYLFGTETITDWKVGSPIRFTGVWEGKAYEDKGTILAIEPMNLLKYDYWSGFSGQKDIPENYQVITYRLNENNGTTVFTLTQENSPTKEASEHSAGNWSMVLNSMKEMIEGK